VPVHCRRFAQVLDPRLVVDPLTLDGAYSSLRSTYNNLGAFWPFPPHYLLPHISIASQASFLVTGEFDSCQLLCFKTPVDKESSTSSDADDRPEVDAVERATVSPYSHPYDTDQAVTLFSTHHMNTFGDGCLVRFVLLFLSSLSWSTFL
jgi:hypothetical protein